MENLIKEFRETGCPPDFNLVINISETQSRGMNLLCREIYDQWTRSDSDKRYLVLVNGEKLLEALKAIKENQAEVLRYRFGLIDGKHYTLDEIAAKLNVGKETLRNRERTGVLRLRNYIKKDNSSIVYSERDTEEQNFTPEEAARRKLLLDRIYNSNLIWVPDKEYEQEPDSMQRSELREIATELKSIQPIKAEDTHNTQNTILEANDGEGDENKKTDDFSIDLLGIDRGIIIGLSNRGIDTIGQLRETPEKVLENVYVGRGYLNKKGAMEIQARLRNFPELKEDYIGNLDFSVRTFNCLSRAGICSISKLQEMSTEELLQIRNMGKKSIEEIQLKLEGLAKSKEKADSVTLPQKETSELERLRLTRDKLAQQVEVLESQLKEVKQLLASYDALLNGNTQKDEATPDLDGE